MKYRLLFSLLCVLAIPLLVYGQTIDIDDVVIPEGSTADIFLAVSNAGSGLNQIIGTITFDNPSIVEVTNVQGLNELLVLAWEFDALTGEVQFGGFILGGGGINDAEFLQLTVLAVGARGQVSSIDLDVTSFRDANGNYIDPVTLLINSGSFTILHTNPPIAAFSYIPPNPVVNETVRFIDESFDVDGDVAEWVWDYGDGVTETFTLPTDPTHEYRGGGNKTVTLTVKDNDGAWSDPPARHTIYVQGPEADFQFRPQDPTTQDRVYFIDKSQDPTADIVGWKWFLSCADPYIEEFMFSDDPNHNYVFAEPGDYKIRLEITNDLGETAETQQVLTVHNALPIANFTFGPPPPVVGQPVQFSSAGSSDPDGQIIGYAWNFDDGRGIIDHGASIDATHTFHVAGVYEVTLYVIDDRGGIGEKMLPVIVGAEGPVADFTFAPQPVRVGKTVSFDGSLSTDPDGTIISYVWEITLNGLFVATHTGVSFNTVFNAPGNYRVQLTVTDNDGLWDNCPQWVVVVTTPPDADFTFTPVNPKIGEVVEFNAVGSNDPDGEIISYEWDYPDVIGVINDTGVKVYHSFNAAGTYPVTLTVIDNDGNRTPITRRITVETTPPVAAFTFTPANPNTGQVISFDASASTDADGTIILYRWDFGDGVVATGLVVTHSYADPDVYPVRLTVTDNDTKFDVTTQGVPVEMGGTGGVNQPPVADFTFEPATPPDVNLNEVVTFKAAGCSDPDGTVEAYEWDFDDDGTYDATGTTVTHIFHRGGGKVVTLRVLDNDGAPGFKTHVVSVEFIRPIADFTYTPTEPRVGDVVSFDGSSSSDGDGRVDFYEWDFDSDGIVDVTGMSVNHVFTTGGSQFVTLKVTDNDGVTDYITKTVPVRINTPPLADFAYSPTRPTTTDTIAFNDTSIDHDGTIIAWQWEFGDGETSDVQSPSHKYATAKTYIAKLTVTDNDGATSSVTENITVGEPTNVPPVANFSFTPTLPQISQMVQFNDLSTDADGTVTGWDWDFGDGGTSTDQNPTHKYTTVGIYTVTLTVADNEGALSPKLEKQVTIGQAGADIVTYSYPNPSSTQAHIVYSYPAGATDITLSIFSVTGARVFSEELPATGTEYLWDLRSNNGDVLPNGLYFCVITAKDASGKTIKSAIFKLLIVR